MLQSASVNQVLALLFGLVLSALTAAGDDVTDRDPFEGFNRAVFNFNDGLDRALFKPVAKGYRAVMPDFAEQGVSNFFANLGEITNIINDVLQLKLDQAAHDSGRFLVNSTLGVAGFIDVADKMGLPRADGEDFGQTLGKWGIDSGPYLMLPFFGPSTLRDAPSRFADSYTNPVRYVEEVPVRNSLYAGNVVSVRAELLAAEDLANGGDRYLFVRDAYLQRRAFLVNDGIIEDDFGSYDDSYDDYDSYEDF